ncbi:hypothetical protein [Beduinella massiliensis]|uniref:hypothetical protein n=1 Tax=Beduinella massiliensis TaxID=1852363 RepID=UPI0011AFA203
MQTQGALPGGMPKTVDETSADAWKKAGRYGKVILSNQSASVEERMKISEFLRLVFRKEDRMNATLALAMAVQALISVLGPTSVQLLGNIVDLAFARERVGMQVICYILICALSFLLALVKSKANSSIKCSIERTLRESVIHRLYSDMKGKHKHGEDGDDKIRHYLH